MSKAQEIAKDIANGLVKNDEKKALLYSLSLLAHFIDQVERIATALEGKK